MITTTYPRLLLQLKNRGKPISQVYGEEIRKGLTRDGLLDAPIAHGHVSETETRDGRATVIFRKGYDCMEILGVGNEAIDYLQSNLHKLMTTDIHVVDCHGKSITVSNPMVAAHKGIDYITVGGGFHQYKTLESILITKGGRKKFSEIMEAKDDAKLQGELIAFSIGRLVAQQLADFEGLKLRDVPKVHVSLDMSKCKVSAMKMKHNQYIQFSGEFGMSALLSGGKEGIGIGKHQSHGYGHIARIGGDV